MRKRVCALLLTCCLFGVQSTTAFAVENDGFETISPYMEYIIYSSSDIYLNTSTGFATADCTVLGYEDLTTKITITMKLQQLINGQWTSVKSYYTTNNSYQADISESYKVSKGYSYRVQAIVKAYSGSASETRTVTSSEVRY